MSYACWQEEEAPTSRRRHLQGYLQLKGERTLNQVRAIFGDLKPHLEKQRARKTDEARDYCLKLETRVSGPFEFGDYCPSGSHRRRQRDDVARSPERVMEENPSLYRRVKAKLAEDEFRQSVPEIEIVNWKSWQLHLERTLQMDPDDRTIIWVYGPTGGEGKSTYARDLYRRGYFYTRGGSADNVAYQYVSSLGRHVVFDIPRDKRDYLQYSLIEMFKDRMIISNKYEPIMAPLINNIHVVVMCNFFPDLNKISSDRVIVIPCIPCGICLKHHHRDVSCNEK